MMEVLEVQLETRLTTLSKRNYPKQCYTGKPFSYIDGLKDGLSEALQLTRIRLNRYKLVGNTVVRSGNGQIES